jgi:hypothetical protein
LARLACALFRHRRCETLGTAQTDQRPALEFFLSYQQLLRIATQHPQHVDIQGIFAPKHSLRDGVNGFLRVLPGDRALLTPSPAGHFPQT